jgi:hypothetical protein
MMKQTIVQLMLLSSALLFSLVPVVTSLDAVEKYYVETENLRGGNVKNEDTTKRDLVRAFVAGKMDEEEFRERILQIRVCPDLERFTFSGTGYQFGQFFGGTVSVVNPRTSSKVFISLDCTGASSFKSCSLTTILQINNPPAPIITGKVFASATNVNTNHGSKQFLIRGGAGGFTGASGTITLYDIRVTGSVLQFSADVDPCIPGSPAPPVPAPTPTPPAPTPTPPFDICSVDKCICDRSKICP